MKLRERVDHLEKWYDRQVVIDSLKSNVTQLEKELSALKDYLGIRIETYKVIAMKKEEGERE